jgi:hypothetical protein
MAAGFHPKYSVSSRESLESALQKAEFTGESLYPAFVQLMVNTMRKRAFPVFIFS